MKIFFPLAFITLFAQFCSSIADITNLYKSLNMGHDNQENSKVTANNRKLANADGASSIDSVIAMMPKIELHAHLHGSIRRSTLESLAQEKNISLNCDYNLDIDQCFGLFKVVHQIISSQSVLTRVLTEMMEDYMNDNVIYLEIRTTPRSLPDGTNDRQYIALLKTLITNHNNLYGSHKMLVKLILSVDRSKSVAYAMDTLQIVDSIGLFPSPKKQDPKHQQEAGRGGEEADVSQLIVGLDFSGNPLGGRFEDFAQVFVRGRAMGLKITVHCAEIKQLSYAPFTKGQKAQAFETDETTFILSFNPERLGHALFLQRQHFDKLLQLKKAGRAPAIEVCPTSNLVTLGLKSYADHPHIRRLLALNYPLSLHTDDSGIFNTTLSKEFKHIVGALGMKMVDALQLSLSAIDQIFGSEAEKASLKVRFWQQVDLILERFHIKGIEELRSGPTDIDISSLYTM